jgi:hypothetical protein
MLMKKYNPFFIFGLLLFCINTTIAQNQLKNPGFETSIGWNFWGGNSQSEIIRSGNYALKVKVDVARWSGADQMIFLQEGVKKVEVSGWMKTENVVQGAQNYEQARIAVEFYDNNGALVGGYPPVTAQSTGTTDWKYYSHVYFVPEGGKQVKIQTVMGNCTGTVYFDDLEVLLYNEGGENVEAGIKTGPMDEGKWYNVELNTKNTGSHYVDWSSLLDAPAGKHGFAKAVNNKIQFEDGTPALFWGTNLVANSAFPSKQQADSVATRLAKMGCNLIRLHHLDANWSNPNIFGNGATTRTLSPASLDKLDYLIAALKKKGIYVYLDLLVHRDFKMEDGIANKAPDMGGKQVGYFDKKLIELQKEYINQLLSHKNFYTNIAYKDEQAILGSEFINESSAFLHFGGDILTEPYRKDLQKQFEEAGNAGKKLSVFDLDYSQGASPRVMARKGSEGDTEATLRFLSKVEQDYYSTMKTYMRSIGAKYLLSGSNFPIPVLAYQYDNYKEADLILTNDYWDHPQLWKINNDWNRILYAPINNTSMLKNPALSTVNSIAKYKWHHKPFMVTEYNACYPNEYILEGIPFVAAYSRLQGVDGMLQFDFTLDALGSDRIGAFSLSKMQDHLAQWVVGAPMFLRGDIKPATGLVLDNISDKQLYSLPNYSDFLDKKYHLTFITKVAKAYGEEKADDASKYDSYFDAKNNIMKSETGQLKLDGGKGVMEVNADKVQGAEGTLKDLPVNLPFISFKVKNNWASLFLVSKENKPLVESKKFYLVAVTPVKMTGQKYNPGRNALSEPGNLPIQAQQMDGELLIKTKATKVKITSLKADGTKGENINFVIKPEGISIKLNEGKTFVYEIEIE